MMASTSKSSNINKLDALSKPADPKMFFLLQYLLVIVLAIISHEHEVIAVYVPPYSFVVNKHTDAAKPLYTIPVVTSYEDMQFLHENFLIDIDAPFTWHDCIVQWNIYPGSCPPNKICVSPVSCEEFECTQVRTLHSYKNPSCSPETNSSTLPGWGFCTCPVNVVNPMTSLCDQALLNYEIFASPIAACAPSSSFVSFPANVTGVMAFSSSIYAYPASLEPIKNTLALCLPSKSSATGVLLIGNGPYYLLPQSNVDVRSYLSYTPLLKHKDSFGYFIKVNSIVIKKRSINVPTNTTTKLSTIDHYTTLRTDIYNGVVRRFSMVTKRLRPAKAVAPFGLCYSTSTAGLKVPNIDFNLPDGKKWVVSTPNSIKQITKDVACLAFVDGGATSEPAIVIGTFQFEDNFLEFNLENSTFGFSSSLLSKKTSCTHFNFTLTKSP